MSTLSRAEVEARLLAAVHRAVAHFAPYLPPETASAVAVEMTNDLMAELWSAYVTGLEVGIKVSHTPALGEIVWRDLTNQADASNAELCPGMTRAVVSKAINKVRTRLGLPLRCPDMAR